MKIAMWSGPRNLSTAMMYSFGNRPDLTVWDEPFYAAYLKATGLDHPMRDQVLASQENDAGQVAANIASFEKPLFLKLMSFHMLESFPLNWAQEFQHIHLIRHPARVIASYSAKREEPTLTDIGFQQQLDIYRRFPGPVIDSNDIRTDPEGMLTKLCQALGLRFDPSMQNWPAGPKPFDGIWAAHWYDAVHKSKGFAGAEGPLPDIEGRANDLVDAAFPFYQEMAKVSI